MSAKGADVEVGTQLGAATGTRYFAEDHLKVIDAVLADADLMDGVAPAIVEPVAVQIPARRQNEPNVTLFAAEPARMAGFGTIERVGGGTVDTCRARRRTSSTSTRRPRTSSTPG